MGFFSSFHNILPWIDPISSKADFIGGALDPKQQGGAPSAAPPPPVYTPEPSNPYTAGLLRKDPGLVPQNVNPVNPGGASPQGYVPNYWAAGGSPVPSQLPLGSPQNPIPHPTNPGQRRGFGPPMPPRQGMAPPPQGAPPQGAPPPMSGAPNPIQQQLATAGMLRSGGRI